MVAQNTKANFLHGAWANEVHTPVNEVKSAGNGVKSLENGMKSPGNTYYPGNPRDIFLVLIKKPDSPSNNLKFEFGKFTILMLHGTASTTWKGCYKASIIFNCNVEFFL